MRTFDAQKILDLVMWIQLREDIRELNGTPEHLCKIFCVAIDPETLKVDLAKTEKTRNEKR